MCLLDAAGLCLQFLHFWFESLGFGAFVNSDFNVSTSRVFKDLFPT